MVERRKRAARRLARVRWSVELGEQFLAIVRVTGNAKAAALALGAPSAFANRMIRDPDFKRRAREAAEEADARLRGAPNAFPHAPKPRPAPLGDGGRLLTGDELGDILRPGRKRPQKQREPVIRRNSRGRHQVTFAREHHWTADIEADFLARLAATGNFDASARAVGFSPTAVHERTRKWPAFKQDCDEALEAADVRIGYRLVAHAHALLRTPGEPRPKGEEEVPFDPDKAMKILATLEARREGRTHRQRKGPPERTFEEAVESIVRKVEAIKRHKALMAREKGEEE